jgi:hypothetical protein
VPGLFFTFLDGTMYYTLFLAVYFLLLIKFEWRKATIARYVEDSENKQPTVTPKRTTCLPRQTYISDTPPGRGQTGKKERT